MTRTAHIIDTTRPESLIVTLAGAGVHAYVIGRMPHALICLFHDPNEASLTAVRFNIGEYPTDIELNNLHATLATLASGMEDIAARDCRVVTLPADTDPDGIARDLGAIFTKFADLP